MTTPEEAGGWAAAKSRGWADFAAATTSTGCSAPVSTTWLGLPEGSAAPSAVSEGVCWSPAALAGSTLTGVSSALITGASPLTRLSGPERITTAAPTPTPIRISGTASASARGEIPRRRTESPGAASSGMAGTSSTAAKLPVSAA